MGVPTGSPDDGADCLDLEFLKLVRAALPTGSTVLITAPASNCVLRKLPTKEMSRVMDYIIYMMWAFPQRQLDCDVLER